MARHVLQVLVFSAASALGAGAGESERARELVSRVAEGDAKVARRSLAELKSLGKEGEDALLQGWMRLPAPYDEEALALLVDRNNEASLAALEAALGRPRVELRRLAAARVSDLLKAHPDRATDILCRLLRDPDPEASDGAAGAIAGWGLERAWRPLLQSVEGLVAAGKGLDRIELRIRALAAVLARHPAELRVREVLDRAAGCDDPELEALWLGVLVESQSAPAFAALREVAQACWSQDPEALEALGLTARPELRALALRGLAADPESDPLLLRGLRDGSSAVRVQALRALRVRPLPEPRRTAAIEGVVGLLADADPSLRQEAHRWLKAVTRQDLPLSLIAWQRWSGQRAAEVRLTTALDEWARGVGHASFEALLQATGYRDREAWLRDEGYESWERFLRDQEAAAGKEDAE